MKKIDRIIISGGGTGGHIFPAIAIANTIKELRPDINILFVGAEGKMEMAKVPEAGYEIIGLPVAGLQRSLSLSNLTLPFKILRSLRIAKKILKDFSPDVVVGVGGYASAPILWAAPKLGIPTLIQEQNSYAGVTNKILGKKASKICVAYDGMEKFFPREKIILTGNPIRKSIKLPTTQEKEEGYKYFNLNPNLPCILVIGGSLGCRTLNNTLAKWIDEKVGEAKYQVIWQSGKYYEEEVKKVLNNRSFENLRNYDFISRMDLAFAVADIVVSRAGAGTISELCAAGKASIFVPSPVVAEDHQTHNAMSLVSKNAALMIPDKDAKAILFEKVEELLENTERLKTLRKNIVSLAKPQASEIIATEILKLKG